MPTSTPIEPEPTSPRPLLVVEPSGSERARLVVELAAVGLEVHVCDDPVAAEEAMRMALPALVLVRWNPDDEAGVRGLLDRLVEVDESGRAWTPVVLLGDGTPEQRAEALERGACDVLTPTTGPVELRARVRAALRIRHRIDELERQAYRDGLTGLINRGALEDQLRRHHEASRRHGTSLSVLIVDIDRFKEINDTHGHPAGDAALRRVATLLSRSARGSDLVARYGGDEFVVVAPACPPASAVLLAARFREGLNTTRDPDADETVGVMAAIPMTLSIGIAGVDGPEPNDLGDLLQRADQALYLAKRSGRDAAAVYDSVHGEPRLVIATVGREDLIDRNP